MLARRKEKLHEMSAFGRARHDIQGRIVSGLFVLVPLGITLFILDFLFGVTVGMIVPLIESVSWAQDMPTYVINILSFSILVLSLYFVGLFATNMLGRRLIELGEAILARIPLVKTIYSASKQVVDAFSIRDKTAARSVALVEFPSKGIRSLAFVTGTSADEHGRLCYRVFLPTTPNPTTGYLLVMKPEDVVLTDLSVEETCKILMSGGIICPDDLGRRTIPAGAMAEPVAEVTEGTPANGDGAASALHKAS